MVSGIDETRLLTGPMQKRYNICLYWGREHHIRPKENDESTILFIDIHHGVGQSTSFLWPKTITITLTKIDDKVKTRIEIKPIDKVIDKEEYVPGMRMFWADILTSFWQYHNVDLTDEYYREYYPIENIRKRCIMRYNMLVIDVVFCVPVLFLTGYFLSYMGFFIGVAVTFYTFFAEMLFNFHFINIVKVSKLLYPDVDPIEPWKMNIISRYDQLVTFNP